MFSIEKTLEEIISFIRKFLFTIYYTFTHTGQLLRGEQPAEKIIRPSLYLLIWMFIHFGQLSVDYNIYNEKPSRAIEDFGKFFEGATLENNLLYVLPMGAIIWLATVLFKRIFFKTASARQIFTTVTYFWLGNFLALVAFYALVRFAGYLVFQALFETQSNRLDHILHLALIYSPYIPPLIILLVIVINRRRLSRKLALAFGLCLPAFLLALSLLTNSFTRQMAEVLDIHKEPLTIMAPSGTDRLIMSGSPIGPADTTAYRWDTDVLVQNDGNKIVRIPKGLSISIYSSLGDEAADDQSDQVDINVDSFDGDSTRAVFTLKPHEYVSLHAHQTLNTAQLVAWKSHGTASKLNPGDYPCLLELRLNDPEGAPYVTGRLKVAFFK